MKEAIESLLETYQPGPVAIKTVRSTPLVLLVGISGAGKDTIKKVLLESGEYYDFVSFTTRQPRVNRGVAEADGVDYHFVTVEEMHALLEQGEMIEAKQYSGNIYGTGIRDLKRAQEAGKIAINDIEVQGVAEYKAISPEVKAIFLLPPSYDEWYRRLTSRYEGNTPDPEDLALRMQTAGRELQTALDARYYAFVVNDTVESAVEHVMKIARGEGDVQKASHGREVARELLEHFTGTR